MIRILGPLAVIGLGLALFAGALRSPLVSDDYQSIVGTPQAGDLSNIPKYFIHDGDLIVPDEFASEKEPPSRFGVYRPISLAVHTINAHLFGHDPLGWRLISLAFHLIAALLVLVIARKLLGSEPGALAAALLFVAHPIHTEAVAMLLSGRAEIMASVFVLASWWMHLASDGQPGRRRWLWNLGSAFLLLLALGSKENAVVLPAVLFLTGWALQGRTAKTLLIRMIPHLVVLLFYLVIHVVVSRVLVVDWALALGDPRPANIIITMLAIQAMYLRLVLLPYPLHLQNCYKFKLQASELGFGAWAAGILIVLLIGLAVWRAVACRRREKHSIWAFGALFFFICLVPVSHLIPHTAFMAERFLYLPSVALCLLVGWLTVRLQAFRRWIPLAAGLPLLVACAWGTLSRNAEWADADILWGKLARCAPEYHHPHLAMGAIHLRQGRPAEALAFFEKAIELSPLSSAPHYNRGVALQRMGRYEEAEQACRKSLSLIDAERQRIKGPLASTLNKGGALVNLGTLLEAKGDFAGARECYRQAVKEDPTHPAAYVNLGNLLQREGRYPEAENLFRTAMRIAPELSESRFNLARLLKATGRVSEAERLYKEILDRDPDHPMAHNNLGNILKDRNRLDAAIQHYQAALRSDPRCVPAHYNLANTLLTSGDPTRAAEHFTLALELQPDKVEALIGLGWARLHLGQTSLAREAAQEAARRVPGHPALIKLFDILRQTQEY